jgi:hypothetical protein
MGEELKNKKIEKTIKNITIKIMRVKFDILKK